MKTELDAISKAIETLDIEPLKALADDLGGFADRARKRLGEKVKEKMAAIDAEADAEKKRIDAEKRAKHLAIIQAAGIAPKGAMARAERKPKKSRAGYVYENTVTGEKYDPAKDGRPGKWVDGPNVKKTPIDQKRKAEPETVRKPAA